MATNLFTNSRDLGASPWSVTRASYDQSAQKLIEDTTAAATHYIEGSVTLATTTTYTVSFEAKPAGRDWAALVLQNVGLSKIAYFDLANGALGASNDEADATITAIGNGWYRCTLFDATTSAGSGSVRVYLSDADADFGVLNGDGSSGIYLRHPQVEAGASFTAYEAKPVPLTIASTTTKVAVNGFARIAEARAPEIVLGADGGILSGVVSSRTHRNVYEIVTPPLLATNAAALVGVLTSGVSLTVSGTLFSSGFTAYVGDLEMDFTEGGLYRVLSFSLFESAT